MLFRNATEKSSQNTSKSGISQFHRFAREYIGRNLHPLPQEVLSLKGLLLIFFTASLFMNSKNLQHATIRNYVCHVRTEWLITGAPMTAFDSKIVARMLRGVGILRPSRPDPRVAFLLPHLTPPPIFCCPLSTEHLLYKAVIIFGFFGMLRFGTFAKLSPQSITLVSATGEMFTHVIWGKVPVREFVSLYNIVGFYLSFKAKRHPNARAYYCTLQGLPANWSALCPLATFMALAETNLLHTGCIFPTHLITTAKLTEYMHTFCRNGPHFSPHSLRIGGHTFYSLQNMNEEFVQFLGRRAIRRASELYYRANPVDNIKRLRTFFSDVSSIAPFMRGLYGAPQ